MWEKWEKIKKMKSTIKSCVVTHPLPSFTLPHGQCTCRAWASHWQVATHGMICSRTINLKRASWLSLLFVRVIDVVHSWTWSSATTPECWCLLTLLAQTESSCLQWPMLPTHFCRHLAVTFDEYRPVDLVHLQPPHMSCSISHVSLVQKFFLGNRLNTPH